MYFSFGLSILRMAIEVAEVFRYERKAPFPKEDNSAGGPRFFVGFVLATGNGGADLMLTESSEMGSSLFLRVWPRN